MAYHLVTYLLWLFGGQWGLHHIYLGRFRQAFLYWATFGGFFGIGWLHDFLSIPRYVKEVNEDPDRMTEVISEIRSNKRPPFSLRRLAAEMVFGILTGVAVSAGLPLDATTGPYGPLVLGGLAPMGVGLAVYLVANIGRERSAIYWPLGGAYMAAPFFLINPSAPATCINYCSIASITLTTWKGVQWRRTKPSRKSQIKLCCLLLLAAGIYTSLWVSCFLDNAYVTTSDGEPVKLRDAFENIKTSQAWQHPFDTFWYLWETQSRSGFDDTWEEFVTSMDPEGEQNAYQVLQIWPGASQKEIQQAYRKLVKQYHPDKTSDHGNPGPNEKYFMEIQTAYEKLSVIKERRARANRVNRDGKDEKIQL